MKLFTVSLFFLLCFTHGFSQITFQKTYGGSGFDFAYSVQQTSDGGYIIGGHSKSVNPFGDALLIRTNSLGDTLWVKTYGSFGQSDGAYYALQTSDGGFVFTGTTFFGLGTGDVYLVKTDSNGNLLWSKTFGGTATELALCMRQTSDGGFILTGNTNGFGAGNRDIYLIKTDSSGNALWSKTFGNTGDDYGESVLQTNDGGYIVAGYMYRSASGYDFCLIKTNSNGNLQWSKSYGGIGGDICHNVIQTSDGGYIMIGDGGSTSTPTSNNVFVVKTDSVGNHQWSKVYGGQNADMGRSIHEIPGGYIIQGRTSSSGAGGEDVFLLKINSLGDTLWAKTYGGAGDDLGFEMNKTNDGGYAITGYSLSFGTGSYNCYLIKTDSLGVSGCNEMGFSITQVLPATQTFLPTTLVSSGDSVTSPATILTNAPFLMTSCTVITNVPSAEMGKSNFSIFPNPATTEIRIKSQESGIKCIEIYNVLGEKVFSKDVTAGNKDVLTINTASFTSGIYFVSIKTAGGIVAKKLVVQR